MAFDRRVEWDSMSKLVPRTPTAVVRHETVPACQRGTSTAQCRTGPCTPRACGRARVIAFRCSDEISIRRTRSAPEGIRDEDDIPRFLSLRQGAVRGRRGSRSCAGVRLLNVPSARRLAPPSGRKVLPPPQPGQRADLVPVAHTDRERLLLLDLRHTALQTATHGAGSVERERPLPRWRGFRLDSGAAHTRQSTRVGASRIT
jgi:hypothetical protein